MNRLLSCAACQRYILATERHCPFCGEIAAARAAEVSPPPRGRSRAAVFAMRTAIAAGVAPALACGGTSDSPREMAQDVTAAGGSSASAAGGTSSVAMNDAQNPEPGSAGSAGGGSASAPGIDIVDEPPSEASADAGDGGFAPVPIYGGVFPDPLARVRV